MAAIKSPRSLLFSRLNNPNCLSLSSEEVLQPSDHFCGLLWTRSNRSISWVCWGEPGAGLTLGQLWEVQGWLGVSACAGMSWEPFRSRNTGFCSRAECLGCSCLGLSGLLLQQESLLLSRATPDESSNCPLLSCTVYSQWL